MTNFFKRVLAVVLCAAMCFASVTVSAFASGALEFIGVCLDLSDEVSNTWGQIKPLIEAIHSLNESEDLNKSSRLLVFWRDLLKKYPLTKEQFIELCLDFYSNDTSTIMEKYGSRGVQYSEQMYDSIAFSIIYFKGIEGLANRLFDSSVNDYEIDSDNNVKVPVPALKDYIQTTDKQYFPKNATGKMSYRTDELYHNRYDTGGMAYFHPDLYSGLFGFSAVGGNEIYLVFFLTVGNETYYGKYQFHMTVTANDVWYEDRDEVEYTNYILSCEYWDMIDGSQSTAMQLSDFSSKSPYFKFYFNGDRLQVYDYFSYDRYVDFYSNQSKVYTNDRFWQQVYKSNLSSSLYIGSTGHFSGSLSNHDNSCSYGSLHDVGYCASVSPLNTLYVIDTTKIPDNYYVTISNDSSTGDTIYNYTLVNPETGQKDTIQNFITNNYTFTTTNEGDTNISGGNGSGGSLSGDITVGGKVEVGGKVDINVNVNGGNSGNVSFPDTDLVENLPEVPQGFIDYLKKLFDFLPAPVLAILIGVIAAAGICRIWGR